ncbi:MAG: hypothetical protein P4L67_02805 [Candidatus Pacebacteria bacterium]|nr:hypothetical protein [Candidatus Paceibacterota bacterium]
MKLIEYRAFIKGTAFSYWKSSGQKLIVFCPGLPQYASSYHPFVQTLVDLGYDLLIPKYHGTWESDGVFSLAESLDSVYTALDVVKSGSMTELYGMTSVNLPKGDPILLGFSYGGFVARLIIDRPVEKKVLLMPFANIGLHGRDGLKNDLLFLNRAYQNVYRFDVEQFVSEVEQFKQPLRSDPFSLVIGSGDKVTSQSEIQFLKEKYNPHTQIVEAGHTANLTAEQYTAILS